MADAIDLTHSDGEDNAPMPKAGAIASASADEQRKRIMAFATGVNAAKRRRGASPAQQQRETDEGPQQKQEQQQQQQQQPAKQDQLGSAPGRAGSSGGAGGGGGQPNSLLAQLHAERMARAQRREGAEAAAAGPSAAPKGAPDPAAHGGTGSRPAAGVARAPAATAVAPTAVSLEGRAGPAAPSGAAAAAAGGAAAAPRGTQQRTVTLLQYNVWFNEQAAVEERMAAIGRIIVDAGHPTFITLQEVTPLILSLLQSSDWWGKYVASDPPPGQPYFTIMLAHKAKVPNVTPRSFRRQPFGNSIMGRCLLTLMTSVGGTPLVVATSHLESPCPPQGMFVDERTHQMREAMRVLDAAPAGNVLFAGDLNWDDNRDGAPPLKAGWCDAWVSSNPGLPGFTYDTKSNKMLMGNWPGNRLDRVLARLRDMRIGSMRIVGQDAIPGVTYTKGFKNGGSKKLPVLPSDHYGLLLELQITT